MEVTQVSSPLNVSSYLRLVRGQVYPSEVGTELHRPGSSGVKVCNVVKWTEDTDTARKKQHESQKNYQRPIFTCFLPRYSLKEQDVVKSAFRPTGHVRISTLPRKLRADNVLSSLATHVREAQTCASYFRTSHSRSASGCFGEVQHVPDPYGTAEAAMKEEKQRSEELMHALGRDPFYTTVSSSCAVPPSARCGSASGRAPGKHTAEVDAYNHTARSRKSLPDMVKAIHRRVSCDWRGLTFSVAAMLDDFIAVVFEEPTVDNVAALHEYMQTMVEEGDICRKYLIKRVKETWGDTRVRAGQIWYLLRPSWINLRTEANITTEVLSLENAARRESGNTRSISGVGSPASLSRPQSGPTHGQRGGKGEVEGADYATLAKLFEHIVSPVH